MDYNFMRISNNYYVSKYICRYLVIQNNISSVIMLKKYNIYYLKLTAKIAHDVFVGT